MTLQEIFDTVAQHLLTQREKSKIDAVCMYRGLNGLKCAIGALIPDSAYREHIEGAQVDELPREIIKAAGLLDKEGVALALDLQDCHDNIYPEDWSERLRDVAANWDLSPAIVDEMERGK